MKLKVFALAALAGLLPAVPMAAASLTAASSVVAAGSLYNYTYTFSISGSGLTADNIFLGSDDLSPLNLTLTFDGNPTADWSWLGNDTPQNYLDFFNTAGGLLGENDTLGVTFTSALSPLASHFAVALDSATGAASNTVTGVIAPTAVPEPASIFTFMVGVVALIALRRRNQGGKWPPLSA